MRIQIILLSALAVSGCLVAADDQTGAVKPEKEAAPTIERPRIQFQRAVRPLVNAARPRTTDSAATSYEAFGNFAVQAGQNLNLASTTDWTGATQVAIAVHCPSATSLQNVQILPYWGVNLDVAQVLTAADVILGKNLAFTNAGGSVVNAYGSQLVVQIRNTGTTAITCDQITFYGFVH